MDQTIIPRQFQLERAYLSLPLSKIPIELIPDILEAKREATLVSIHKLVNVDTSIVSFHPKRIARQKKKNLSLDKTRGDK